MMLANDSNGSNDFYGIIWCEMKYCMKIIELHKLWWNLCSVMFCFIMGFLAHLCFLPIASWFVISQLTTVFCLIVVILLYHCHHSRHFLSSVFNNQFNVIIFNGYFVVQCSAYSQHSDTYLSKGFIVRLMKICCGMDRVMSVPTSN